VVAEHCAAGIKARRNDAAVVEHEQVARLEDRRKIRKERVTQSASGAIELQHATHTALCRRLLRNQLLGQVKIEVGDEQPTLGFLGHGLLFMLSAFPKC
jgi:hypothetical protein